MARLQSHHKASTQPAATNNIPTPTAARVAPEILHPTTGLPSAPNAALERVARRIGGRGIREEETHVLSSAERACRLRFIADP